MTTSFANIVFDPMLPVWALLTLAGAILAFLALCLWRRTPGVVFRALAFAVAFTVLLNPTLVQEQREGLNDIAVIVVDESESQDIGERKARLEQAIETLTERLEKQRNLDVRIVRSDAKALAGRADGTHLTAAMQRALGDVAQDRLAAVVLLTDGQVHDLPADIPSVQPAAPVHVMLTGDKRERDRRLVIERAPTYGIVGEGQIIVLRVEDNMGTEQDRARLTVHRDGEQVYSRLVPLNRSWQVPFDLQHGGHSILELQVEAVEDELSTRNNRAILEVNGVRDRLRVLLVSGEPHPGERTWRNILKSDPAVDLIHFTILRPPEKHDGTPIRELSLISFPTRQLFQKRLKDFDLVIFDRYRRRGVLPSLYLRNVVKYVQEGGAVLTSVGPSFASRLSLYRTPLSGVLPAAPTGDVVLESYRPELTPMGLRHPVTADLEGGRADPPRWGRWLRIIDSQAEDGNILMRGAGDRPLLVLQRIGEGRVAQIMSDHIWLWARGYDGGGPQQEFLRRLAHWLMKEPELEEDDLRAVEHNGQLRISRRSLRPEKTPVTITTPSGKTIDVELEPASNGTESATVKVEEAGLFKLDDGKRKAVAAIGENNPREFADMLTTEKTLAPLVEASGGGTFWLADLTPTPRKVAPGRDSAGGDWFGLLSHGKYTVTGIERTTLLPSWLAVLLVVGLLLLGWRWESR